MTAAQKSLWFAEQLREESSGSSNTSVYALRLKGTLRTDLLIQSLKHIFSRHEALRTSFKRNKDNYLQVVDSSVSGVILNTADLSKESEVETLIHKRLSQVPKLETGPLLEFDLACLSADEQVFIITVHHLVFDGWSIGVFTRELSMLYNQLLQGQKASLPPLPIQYGDYAAWKEKESGQILSEELSHWQQYLSGANPQVDIPTEQRYKNQRRINGKSQRLQFEPEFIEQIQVACQQFHCSSFTLLFSVYALMLSKYSGQDDLLIAVPFANRNRKELEPMIGLFVNMLPVRVKISCDMCFKDVLKQVTENMIDLQGHQSMDFATLQEHLSFQSDQTRHQSIFNAEFSYINADFGQLNLEGIESTTFPYERKYARKDLTFFVYDYGQGLSGEVLYDADLIHDSFISRFINNLKALLQDAIGQPETKISQLAYITVEERALLLEQYNNTKQNYPDASLTDLFRQKVIESPGKIAIRHEDKEVSYKDLETMALVTANLVIQEDMGTIVPIITANPLSMIIGMLGTLLADRAYMPIESGLAEERVQHMIKDAGALKVLVEKELNLSLSDTCTTVEFITDTANPAAFIPDSLPERKNEQTCYVMYTSGTTGKAKGVMISDKSVVRLVKSTNYISLSSADRLLQTAPLTFDASTLEIWGALLNGGTLVLSRKTSILSASVLEKELRDQQITVLWLTSPLFGEMAAISPTMFAGLRYLVVGGDVIPLEKMNAVRQACPDINIVNGYGPTENTTFSATYPIEHVSEGPIPIGKPVSNSTAYVLDEGQNLLPHGAIGTLYVGGDGLAQGYLNDPELTGKKFISHPYRTGETLYNTGDLVRWQHDGNLQFIGRNDRQLKISGFRVEPAEVEQLLENRPEVTHAVVKVDNTRLVAYVVTENPDTSGLKDYLQRHVLAVMVPEQIIAISEIPKTPNGKVDFKSLPDPQKSKLPSETLSNISDVQKRLIAIWSASLEIEEDLIAPNASFFEIGGHSLMATQLISAIEKEFDLEIDLGDFFEDDTITFLESVIKNKGDNRKTNIPVLEPRTFYNISHSQKRIWVIDQIEGGAGVYDIATTIRIKGSLKRKAFTYALSQMIKRYDILRTCFVYHNDEVFQQIEDGLDIDKVFQYQKWEDIKHEFSSTSTYLAKVFARPFDLSKPPLFQLVMLELNDQEFLLASKFHHIISDEWSSKLFIRELSEYYNARINNLRFVKEKLTIQYKDFADWNLKKLKLDETHSKDYWLSQLQPPLPLNELRYKAGSRPATKTYEATSISRTVEKSNYEALNQFASSQQTSLYVVLMAALQLVIRKYSGESDVIVGTAISGREHHQLENQLGLYANTVAIRSQLQTEDSFSQHLHAVKKTVSEAFSHADYPFDKLVDDLQLKNDPSRSPVFETAFLLQDLDLESIDTSNFGNLSIENVQSEVNRSAYDLIFNTRKKADSLSLEVIFNTNLFDTWFIEQIVDHYLSLLDQILANHYLKLDQYEFETTELFNCLKEARVPDDGSIIDHFESQVRVNPDHEALKSDHLSFTYQELKEFTDFFATQLIEDYDINPGNTVALISTRKDQAVAAIPGILKTGANYLPLNPEEAPERLQFMLLESQAKLIVTDAFSNESMTGLPQLVISDMLDQSKEKQYESVNRCNARDNAYTIYTSGSSGLPKGVMVSHRSVINLVKNTNYLRLDHHNNMLQFSPLFFDPSIMEIFGALLNGATLTVVEKEKALESKKLAAHIKHHNVDQAVLTTAYFNTLVEIEPTIIGQLDKLYFGGESASTTHVRKAIAWQKKPGAIVNLYGPTETTTCSLYHEVIQLDENALNIAIGRPISGTWVYVLDQALKPVPRGIMGELYIGGYGLSTGYLENPKLTSEKFITSPFDKNEKLYKTGDLACLNKHGQIEFKGRVDAQVKIRGHRIEIGEVESAIMKLDGISSVKVLPQETNGRTEVLIAYLTVHSLEQKDNFKALLAKSLPSYMIPGFFVIVETFPVNQNGKIDIQKLMALGMHIQKGDICTAETQTEKQLSVIWQKHLNTEEIGVDQNFFEVGGHSLTAMKVASEIYHETGVNVPLKEFYVYPTIRELSSYIESINWITQPAGKEEMTGSKDVVI